MQQKIVESCGVSALLFTFRGMWPPRLYLLVYDLVIPTARLERAGSDTRRSVCRRIIFRNTIAERTIRYVQCDYYVPYDYYDY